MEQFSEAEFRNLAGELAPKVNLFQEAWSQDPKAEFYGGTSRDFLYWIKGKFQKARTPEDAAKIAQDLRAMPVIDVKSFIIGDSDVDIISDSHLRLDPIRFGVRKIDTQSPDMLNSKTELGMNERNQGHAPAEKIRLTLKGLQENPGLGDGAKEIYTGKLTVHFAPAADFAKTKYAKEGLNHPILLALRYIRLEAMNYFREHGDGAPNLAMLEAQLDGPSFEAAKKVIADAQKNSALTPFFKQDRFRSWVNGTIQKAFRSYTNPSAARELMRLFGVDDFVKRYSESVEPINQYVFAKNRDQSAIDASFNKARLQPKDIYADPAKVFPDGFLYHGTKNEESFRSIVFQGIMGSESGSGGEGLYGVSEQNKQFAEGWGKSRDRLLKFPVKPDAKIIDITSGAGEKLWLQNQRLGLDFDEFAEKYGADILRYPYHTEAYVVKNSAAIGNGVGVYRELMTLEQFAQKLRATTDFTALSRLLSLPNYSADERTMIAAEIDGRLAKGVSVNKLTLMLNGNEVGDVVKAKVANRLLIKSNEITDSPTLATALLKSDLPPREKIAYMGKAKPEQLAYIITSPLSKREQQLAAADFLLSDPKAAKKKDLFFLALSQSGASEAEKIDAAAKANFSEKELMEIFTERKLSGEGEGAFFRYLFSTPSPDRLRALEKMVHEKSISPKAVQHLLGNKEWAESVPDLVESYLFAPVQARDVREVVTLLGNQGYWSAHPERLEKLVNEGNLGLKSDIIYGYFNHQVGDSAWKQFGHLFPAFIMDPKNPEAFITDHQVLWALKLKMTKSYFWEHPEYFLDLNLAMNRAPEGGSHRIDADYLGGRSHSRWPEHPFLKKLAGKEEITSAVLAKNWAAEKKKAFLASAGKTAAEKMVSAKELLSGLRANEASLEDGTRAVIDSEIPTKDFLALVSTPEDESNILRYVLPASPGSESERFIRAIMGRDRSTDELIVKILLQPEWIKSHPGLIADFLAKTSYGPTESLVRGLQFMHAWEKNPGLVEEVAKKSSASAKSILVNRYLNEVPGAWQEHTDLFLPLMKGTEVGEPESMILWGLKNALAKPELSQRPELFLELARAMSRNPQASFHRLDTDFLEAGKSRWAKDKFLRKINDGAENMNAASLVKAWESKRETFIVDSESIPLAGCAKNFAGLEK